MWHTARSPDARRWGLPATRSRCRTAFPRAMSGCVSWRSACPPRWPSGLRQWTSNPSHAGSNPARGARALVPGALLPGALGWGPWPARSTRTSMPSDAKRSHLSGSPFSSWSPRVWNLIPDPTKVVNHTGHKYLARPREPWPRVRDVHGDPGEVVSTDCALTGVKSGGRISNPRTLASSTIACAHWTARAGPSNAAIKPSPVVLISRPRNRRSLRGTSRSRARRAAGATVDRPASAPVPSNRRCRCTAP